MIEGARRIGKSTVAEEIGNKEVFGKKIATQYIIHPKNFAIDGEIVKIPPYMLDVAFK